MTRRDFCKGITGLIALMLGQGLASIAAYADTADKVDENSDLAHELGYKHDASQVNTGDFPKRAGADAQNQLCKSCQFFGGAPGDEWGECVVFAGKQVNANGWCNSWFERVT